MVAVKLNVRTLPLFLSLISTRLNTNVFRCVLVVMNYEQDIGLYTIKVATDPRACNRTVIYRPSTNVLTQLELISKWEKKTGKNFKKIHIPEEEVVALSESKP